MTEIAVPIITKAVDLAFKFLDDHLDKFADAEQEQNGGMISMPRREFDEWCVARELLSALPDSSTIDEMHYGLVQRRNVIRMAINSVAVYGKHGWPPYEICARGEMYTIRLIEPLLEVVTKEVSERIEKNLRGRLKVITELGKKWSADERLPKDLRERWRTNQRMYSQMTNNCRSIILNYLEEFRDDHRRTVLFLADQKKNDTERK